MTKRYILLVIVILLCAATVAAQSRRRRPSSVPRQSIITDIRLVDFLNFTYHPSLCSQDEFGRMGIGKTVRVRKGEFKNKNVYFGVVDNKVIYGDVTGDGREDAIIHVACGVNGSTYGLGEVFIYTLQNGRAALLAETNDEDMTRDYVRYYPKGGTFTMWWGIRGVKVRNGNVQIEALVDGSHAAPVFIVTLEYRWNNGTFMLSGRPRRTVFRNTSETRYFFQLFNCDDSCSVSVNGVSPFTSSETKFAEDSGWEDFTYMLQDGRNEIKFTVNNEAGAIAYGIRVMKNDSIIFEKICGRAGTIGCENNRVFPKGVAREFTYTIVK